jgi:hypothetical protein
MTGHAPTPTHTISMSQPSFYNLFRKEGLPFSLEQNTAYTPFQLCKQYLLLLLLHQNAYSTAFFERLLAPLLTRLATGRLM